MPAKRAEGHTRRGHAGILTADDHDAVGFGDEHDDALEAAAGGHRVFHDGVHGHFLDDAMRANLGILVGAFPIPFLKIDYTCPI